MAEQPQRTDTVYHLTDLGRLFSIQLQGLQPDAKPEDIPEMRRRIDKALDHFRPDNIVELGISRSHAVYAHPYLERLSRLSLGAGTTLGTHEKPIALAADIDPENAMVLDAKLLDLIAQQMFRMHGELPKEVAMQYWETAMPLAEYRSWFDARGRLRQDAPSDHPPHYFDRPEVLIPGSVDSEHITWVASILTAEQLEVNID